jgi:hypothetical protein
MEPANLCLGIVGWIRAFNQQQLTRWYQQASAYGHLTDGLEGLVAQELQTAQGYAATYGFELGSDGLSGGWDPTSGMGADGMSGMGVGSQGTATAVQYGELIWQDQTRAKWDGSDSVVYPVNQQSDSRQQDFFQSDVTIQSPYHGAVAKAELVNDDSVAAPAKMLKVSFTMSDGSTKVVCVHNVTDKTKIQLQSSDQSNIHLDASLTSSALASQVTVEDLTDDSNTTVDQGTPPDPKTKNNWTKNRSVDLTATEGKDTFIVKSHDLNLSLLDYSQNAYITKTAENHYTIEIRDDDGKIIRRIEAETKQINLLNTDSDKVFYKDATVKKGSASSSKVVVSSKPKVSAIDVVAGDISTGDGKPTGFEAWTGQDTQITVGDEEGDSKVGDDPNPEPNSFSKDGKTANYISKDETLTAYYDGKYKNIKVTSGPGGTVTLNTASIADNVWIEKNQDGTYTILMESGEDPSKEITYTVEGPPTKILIGNANIGKIKYVMNDGEWRSPKDIATAPFTSDLDPLIEVEGEKSTPNMTKLDQRIKDLGTLIGKGSDDDLPWLLDQIGSHFPFIKDFYDKDQDGKLSVDEINTAIQAGAFPPANLTQDTIKFLFDIDPVFHSALASVHPGDANGLNTATPRLVDLLKKLYPDQADQIYIDTYSDYYPGNWVTWNDLRFKGTRYSYSSESGDLSTINLISG